MVVISFNSIFDNKAVAVGSGGQGESHFGNLGIWGDNMGHEREISGDRSRVLQGQEGLACEGLRK